MSSTKKRSRATLATVNFDAGLRSSLVHLPIALYGPLLERGVPPQSIVVELVRCDHQGDEVEMQGNVDKVYVGWSGMSAALPSAASSGTFSASSSQATSVVAMSPTLATTFSPILTDGSFVKITLLRSPPLPTASRVDVVPLTPDDWEILSLNADEVENNMLGQVRAARTGMTIAVHVGRQGRTVCRFRVESCDPPTQSYDDDADSTLARAVRLSTDTEVVIAPRTRKTDQATNEQAEELDFSSNKSNGSNQSGSSTSSFATPLAAQQYLACSPFRILPSRYAKRLTSSRLAPVVLHPDDAQILSIAFGQALNNGQGRCSITKMPCPAAPQIFASASLDSEASNSANRSSTLHKSSSQSTENTEATQDGNASGNGAAPSATPSRATTSSYFASANPEDAVVGNVWPRRQVIVSEEVRRKLGLHDFDLVRFSSPSPIGSSAATTSRPSSPSAELERDEQTVLAGYDKILDTCTDAISNAFRICRWESMRSAMQPNKSSQLSTLHSGLLLTGSPGSGKTSVAKVVADRLSNSSLLVSTIYIDCTPHNEERLSSMRALFDQWLASAIWHSPTLLILDNLDRIMPADQEHVDSPRSAQIAEALMHRIREVAAQYSIFVLATAQSNLSINKVYAIHHIFGENVELKAPMKEGRRDILNFLVAKRKQIIPQELNFTTIAGQTEGYMPADLRDLVERAVHQSAVRSLKQRQRRGVEAGSSNVRSLMMEDFDEAQKGFTPLSLRDIKLTQSATRWSDIGGLQETRRVLRETLEWPTKYAKVFAQCPLRLRSGLLLYGYPGCGKTLLAGAVARECGLNFISVKGPEILNKYIGASEKSVRDLFDRAQAAKPCVLFFDEFDSIAPKRGHDSTGVTDRVVNQLLTQMDGAEGLSGVYVLAATSRPDLIDSALLRPGRLDKSLLCDLPSEEDRLDILQVLCGSNRIRLSEDVDLKAWAKRTQGFSGADLQALVYNANLEAIHEGMNAAKTSDEEKKEQANGDNNGSGNGSNANNIRFVNFGGSKKGKSTTLSGAEKQALQRRMELILNNSRQNANASASVEEDFTKQNIDTEKKKDTSVMVTEAQLQRCLRSTRQSVPAGEAKRLRKIYQQFVGERSGEFPDGEASNEVGARQSLM
ncbi:AAA-domain-containing protein [Meira miltonrushii]|uniref:Peroxisomal ATPase PEX1 n=1 Tax=Meira miltonrushii TaxID=1280837 RepID=A0A316V2G3_9BASI|nr:AAA-domain-containing protein [Meira miltonrushii]PWN31454.1 AAA-domain-containing protein [Meira miltonrushii]